MFVYTQENIQTRSQLKQIVNLAQCSHITILLSDKHYIIAHFGKEERVPLARADTLPEAEGLLRLILQSIANQVPTLDLTEPNVEGMRRALSPR